MSYLKRTTLEDFQEAWEYGVKLDVEEILRFDKLIDKIEKEQGEDSKVVQWLLKIREDL
jgi:hypothetical protein